MTEPIVQPPANTAERTEHDNARFAHMQEEQAWEKEAQMRKVKIIAGFVLVGALVWAYMVFR